MPRSLDRHRARTEALEALAQAEIALEAEVLELTVEIAYRERDRLAATAPSDAIRALFDHELRARTDFAALEADRRVVEAELTERALEDRRRALDAIVTDLRAQGPPASILARLDELDSGLRGAGIDELDRLITDALGFYRQALEQAATAGAERVTAEAAAQGVGRAIAWEIGEEAAQVIVSHSRRLSQAPLTDAVRSLREAAYRAAPGASSDGLMRAIGEASEKLSPKGVADYASQATNQAYGVGRQAGVDALPEPERIYASELLDGNTCPACYGVDGKEYASIAESLEDYPVGGYRGCDGGLRCRGTRVFVWPAESPPATLDPAEPTPPTPGPDPWPPSSPDDLPRRFEDLPEGLSPDDPVFEAFIPGEPTPGPDAIAVVDEIVDAGVEAEPLITAVLDDLAAKSKGQLHGRDFRFKVDPFGAGRDMDAADLAKSRLRIAQKVQEGLDEGLDIEDVVRTYGDQVRYTLVIEDADYATEIERITRELADRGYQPVKDARVGWGQPGYKGVNTVYIEPSTGVNFELQFHTPSSVTVKDPAHKWYEIERNPDQPSILREYAAARGSDLWATVPNPPAFERLIGLRLPTPTLRVHMGSRPIELSSRALAIELQGRDLVDGQRFQISGAFAHSTQIGDGTGVIVNGRLVFVDEALEGTEELIEQAREFLGTIPPELGEAVETLVLSSRLQAFWGPSAAATSNGPTIAFWGLIDNPGRFNRGIFDHELGHSIRVLFNRQLRAADRVELAERMGVELATVLEWLGDGPKPGSAWTKAMTADRRAGTAAEAADREVLEIAREIARTTDAGIVETWDTLRQLDDPKATARLLGLDRALTAKEVRAIERSRTRARFRPEPELGEAHPIAEFGRSRWTGADRSGVSSYGAKNAAEDWAESIRLFLADRRFGRIGTSVAGDVRFADLFPRRAELLDTLAEALGFEWWR